MKKIIVLMLATALPLIANAQLRVDSTGNVRIDKILTCKQISSSTNTDSWVGTFQGNSRGLKVLGSTVPNYWYDLPYYMDSLITSETFPLGLQVSTNNYHTGAKSCFGLFSTVDNTYGQIYERSQSITGIARGSCTQGQTFGVVGSYEGYGGAGVYGSIYNNTPVSDGRYAGFFAGNVKVTGTLNGVVISSSDLRLKQDVRELGETDGSILDKLEMLSPISYKYDANLLEPKSDKVVEDSGDKKIANSWTNPIYEKTHYGLIAQELQQVYPDLVYENDNGYLSINYTELIPVLIQGIKELKAKVEQLSSPTVRKAKIVETGTTEIDAAIADVAGMDQNVPNPFSGETDIAIYLPGNIQTAILYIYDMSGKQVEQHAIEGRGNTTMTIHADRMDAGMYIYSLIADNKVVATKRMIVVK